MKNNIPTFGDHFMRQSAGTVMGNPPPPQYLKGSMS
jgi:hypothetical protein